MAVSVLVRLVDQMTGGLSNLQGRLERFAGRMQAVGRRMTAFVTTPLAGLGALTLRTAGNFEQAMNRVQALSGATGDQFDQLRRQARDLGAATQFSASEAADAMGFLAMAGFDANEIIGAMPATLQLAAAAQMDLANTADVVSNVLTGYRMETEELGHATDVLVTAFTSANTDLMQLGEAMKYAGPVASAAGVEFEEAAAALSLMGNAGIQGSMAGTSLRGAISRILNPTKQVTEAMTAAGLSFTDAQGKLLPLAEIIEQLEPHAENAGLFMELFGQRAGPAMAALVAQGSDALEDFTGKLRESGGAAERIADVQMAGLNGVLRQLASAWEELQLGIADAGLLDWATEAAQALTTWIRTLGETDPAMLRFITVITMIVAALGPVVLAIGFFASALAAVLSPIGLVIVAVAALAAAAAWVYANWDGIAEWFAELWERMATAIAEFSPVEAISAAWDAFVQWFAGAGERVRAAFEDGVIQGLVTALSEFSPLGIVMGKVDELVDWLTGISLSDIASGWIAELDAALAAWAPIAVVAAAWNAFVEWVRDFGARIVQAVREAWDRVREIFSWSGPEVDWPELLPSTRRVVGAAVEAADLAWSGLVDTAEGAVDGVISAVEAGWSGVRNVFEGWDASAALREAWSGLADTAATLASGAARAASDAWAGVTTAASDAWEGARTVASGAWEGITGLFGSGVDTSAIEEAKRAWQELEAAIASWSPRPAIEAAMQEATSYLASLSWHEQGVRLMETLAQGIRDGAVSAVAAVRDVAQELRDHLPSSPARLGPLSDLDRLNFGETIARSIDARPAAAAMRRLAAAAMAAGAIGMGAPQGAAAEHRTVGGTHGFAAVGAGTARAEVGGRIVVEAAAGARVRNVQSDNPAVPIVVDRGNTVDRA